MVDLINIPDGDVHWGANMRTNLTRLSQGIDAAELLAAQAYALASEATGGGGGSGSVDQTARDLATAAQGAANDAQQTAEGRYLLPASGIPEGDLSSGVRNYFTRIVSLETTAVKSIQGRVIYAGYGALAKYAFPTSQWSSGGSIIAFGRGVLGKLTDARDSVAIGDLVMENTILTRDNIGIGSRALRNVQSEDIYYNQAKQAGTRNIGVGSNALLFVEDGYTHVAIGRNSGQCIVGGRGLTAVGYQAVGGYAPIGLTEDQENWAPFGNGSDYVYTTAVGFSALEKTTASTAVAVGGRALFNNKKSEGNTAVGAEALRDIDVNVGYGGGSQVTRTVNGTYTQSGTTITLSITGHGAAVGDMVFFRLLDGPSQTFQSDQIPGYVKTVPNANTLTLTSPKSISGSGTAAIYKVEKTSSPVAQAGNHTAVGYQAGVSTQTGTRSTFVGAAAGSASVDSAAITAIGSQALTSAVSGGNTVAVGYFAAGNISGAADRITAVGSQSMRNKIDGTQMTDGIINATAVGAYTAVSGSNQVQLGNSATTTYVYGTVQNRSDARDKADVRDTVLGLDFINAVRPVDYRWDMREDYLIRDDEGEVVGRGEPDGTHKRSRYHHGVIAQEIAEVIEETGVDFGGYQDHSREDGGSDILSIGYDEFVGPLIKAVQELSAKVQELEEKLNGNTN